MTIQLQFKNPQGSGNGQLYLWAQDLTRVLRKGTPGIPGPTTPQTIVYATDFGAVGDGNSHPLSDRFATLAAAQTVYPFAVALTDEFDWAGLQAMAFFLATNGGLGIVPGKGPYLINREVDYKNQNATSGVLTGNQFPFSQQQPFRVLAPGNAQIKATAAMNTMFALTFNTSPGATAPWYSVIEGFYFNGNSLAIAAISCLSAFGTIIHNNRINNTTTYGIFGNSFGRYHIYDNEITAKFCIYDDSASGFGDSVCESNDLYPLAGGAGVRIAFFGGDTKIRHNVFTGTGNIADTVYGVEIDGSATQGNTIMDVVIDANEFAGLTSGVQIFGSATPSPPNVVNIDISKNHTVAFSNVNTGTLVTAQNASGLNIHHNFGNDEALGIGTRVASSYFVQLSGCFRCQINHNLIRNYSPDGVIQLFTSNNNRIESNDFFDVGQSSQTNAAVRLASGCVRNLVWNNGFVQTNNNYGLVGVREEGTADFNDARNNLFQYAANIGTPYVKANTNSNLQWVDYGSAAPANGTFLVGALRYNNAPAHLGTIGFVCTTAGTPGTWNTWGGIN